MPTQLSHLDALEAESIHIIREVVAEFERPVLLFSGGKDSAVLLHLAEKAFWPARIPFPVMHVDTGHNFPEVIEFRDRRVGRARRPARRRLGAGGDRRRPDRRATRARRVAQPPADDDAARRDRRAPLRRRVRRGAARRGEGPRRRSASSRSATSSGSGTRSAQRPELWNLYNGRHRPGEHIRVFPLSNWTELDIWQYIAAERDRAPVDLLRPPPRGVPPRRDAARARPRTSGAVDGEVDRGATVRLPHRRRHDLHRRRSSHRPPRSTRSSPRSPRPGSPSGARPAPTTASPRRRWRTASGRATSEPMELLRFATAGSVDDGKSTLIGRLLLRLEADLRGPARGGRADEPRPRRRLREPGAAHRRAARRARAGHHDRRRLPLLRHAAAQVHHRRHPGPHPAHAEHGHGRVDRRPRARARRRPQRHPRADRVATPSSRRCCGSRTSCSASTRWTSSTTTEERFDEIRAEFTDFAAKLDIGDLTFIPISALLGDNVVSALGEHALVRGPVAAAPPRGGAHRAPTAT